MDKLIAACRRERALDKIKRYCQENKSQLDQEYLDLLNKFKGYYEAHKDQIRKRTRTNLMRSRNDIGKQTRTKF